MADDSDVRRTLLLHELALARRDLAGLPGGVEAVIDDEFVEFGSSGRRWSRAATLDALRDAPPADVEIEAFLVDLLSDDIALVTYRSRVAGPDGRRTEALRASVWVRRDGAWRIRFHQGTAARG
jgi:hypothetical protein